MKIYTGILDYMYIDKLQSAINSVSLWADKWHVKLNAEKCKSMTAGRAYSICITPWLHEVQNMWSNVGHSLLILTSPNCSQIQGHFPVWCGGRCTAPVGVGLRTMSGQLRRCPDGSGRCLDGSGQRLVGSGQLLVGWSSAGKMCNRQRNRYIAEKRGNTYKMQLRIGTGFWIG